MKKFLSLILALALCLGLSVPATAVEEENEEMEADRAEIETVVETYLRECSEAIFLAKDHDFSRNTIYNQLNDKNAVSLQQTLEARERNHLKLMIEIDPEPTKLEDFTDNLRFQNVRIEYLRRIHELYNITYTQFNSSYTFEQVVVDGDYAFVSVCENLDYQYSGFDVQSSEQNMYNVSLIKKNGKWSILEVLSNDMFFLTHYKSSLVLEKEIRRLDSNAIQLSSDLAETDVEEVEGAAVPLAAGNIAYNRDNAINYALTYLSSADDGTGGVKPTWANSNMPWYSANCMNFASQCIWAGFGGSNSSTDISNFYGMDTEGTSESHKWYASKSASSPSWRSCSNFRNYISNTETGKVDMVCTTQEIASNSDNLIYAANALKGAAIQGRGLDNNNNPVALGHVVFVTQATGNARNKVLVSAYNNNIRNKSLALVYPISSSVQATDRLLIIIPGHMRNADTGFRLWASLCDVMPSGASVPIKGYANKQCTTISVHIYNPSGTLATVRNFSNTSSVSTSYVCASKGLWKIVLTGTDSSNATQAFTYTIRVN